MRGFAVFAIAIALIHNRLTMDEIADTTIRDPRVLDLCDRTTYTIDDKSAYPRHYSGALVMRLRNGRSLTARDQPRFQREASRPTLDIPPNRIRALPPPGGADDPRYPDPVRGKRRGLALGPATA